MPSAFKVLQSLQSTNKLNETVKKKAASSWDKETQGQLSWLWFITVFYSLLLQLYPIWSNVQQAMQSFLIIFLKLYKSKTAEFLFQWFFFIYFYPSQDNFS